MMLCVVVHLALVAPGRPPDLLDEERVVYVKADEGARGLERARAAVRAARVEDPARDVTVQLGAGVYVLAEPLVFEPEDGGGGGGAVTWAAEPEARVVLSGGRALDDWGVEVDGSLSHAVPGELRDRAIRQLFVAGERRPRCLLYTSDAADEGVEV